MKRAGITCALLLSLQCYAQENLQEFNVSGIQCQRAGRNVTPPAVQDDPDRYMDSCVQWSGAVSMVANADVDGIRVWVFRVPGRYAYCGPIRLGIRLDGMDGAGLRSRSLRQFEFLCPHMASEIHTGDRVSFVGKVLGVATLSRPLARGMPDERIVIGVTEIHQTGKEERIPMPADLPAGR
jgi:hypothetical protein